MIAASIIDYDREATKIMNTESLPRGLNAPFLLVVLSPYDGVYIAKRWLRKLPARVSNVERIIRF